MPETMSNSCPNEEIKQEPPVGITLSMSRAALLASDEQNKQERRIGVTSSTSRAEKRSACTYAAVPRNRALRVAISRRADKQAGWQNAPGEGRRRAETCGASWMRDRFQRHGRPPRETSRSPHCDANWPGRPGRG